MYLCIKKFYEFICMSAIKVQACEYNTIIYNITVHIYSVRYSHWPGGRDQLTFHAFILAGQLGQILKNEIKDLCFPFFLDLGYLEILAIDVEICFAPFQIQKSALKFWPLTRWASRFSTGPETDDLLVHQGNYHFL